VARCALTQAILFHAFSVKTHPLSQVALTKPSPSSRSGYRRALNADGTVRAPSTTHPLTQVVLTSHPIC
jgi:hypothetical protein